MKMLQSWVDLWAIRYPGVRAIFVGQVKAMLTAMLQDIETKAARNAVADGTLKGQHHLAIVQTLKEIEELK